MSSFRPLGCWGYQPPGVRFWSALQSFPVMVGSGLDAHYQGHVPENVVKMFHLSTECRSCISLRYLAGNPPCCQYWSMSETCGEEDGPGKMGTPALGSRAWAHLLVWHQLATCWETPPQRYCFHFSLGTIIVENQGFQPLASECTSYPTRTRGSLNLLKNWLLRHYFEASN